MEASNGGRSVQLARPSRSAAAQAELVIVDVRRNVDRQHRGFRHGVVAHSTKRVTALAAALGALFLVLGAANLAAAGLSEASRLAKLEDRCWEGDDRACARLVRIRLELAEVKGAAYLPSPSLDACLGRWAAVSEVLAAAAKTSASPVVADYAISRLGGWALADIAITAPGKEVRLKAVDRLCADTRASAHQQLLADIAKTAPDREARHRAVDALWEPELLADPAIQSLLLEVAKTAPGTIDRERAAAKLSDPALLADAQIQALLVEAVYNRQVPVETRVEAVGKIRDEAVLAEIARGQRTVADSLRAAAVARLTSQAVLIEIARSTLDSLVRTAAVSRLAEEAVVRELAETAMSREVRAAAIERFLEMWAGRCNAAAGELARLSPGDAVGIEEHLFSTHPGSREDKVVAQLRAKNRAYLRSVLSALGYREPASVRDSGAVIQYTVVLSPVAVMYYPVPATGGGPGGMQFTAAKARGLVSLRAGDRCAALGSIERETRPPESISYKDDLSPTGRYAEALNYWTGDALKSVLATIRPTQQQLEQLVKSCADWDLSLASRVVYYHVEDPGILAEFATKHEDWVIRYAAASRLEDQAVLARIVSTDTRSEVRAAATRRLTDQALLSVIARTDENRGVRAAATERLTDQQLLGLIARNDAEEEVRKAAIKKLTDRDLLRSIAAVDPAMRGFAEVRLWKLEHGEP